MNDLDNALLASDASINEALRSLEASEGKIVLVVDPARRLLGTVTDGDIRRGILRGVPLNGPVERVMNRTPVTAAAADDPQQLMQMMQRGGYKQIPLVDGDGRVVAVETLTHLLEVQQRDNWVVIMAGGLGTRLRPLTDGAAKPMLQVGDKPILETIIENFVDHGFQRFFITLNYRADDIVGHFGNGSELGVEIVYVTEDEPLGTAGALRLLPERPSERLIVMNGDILTKVDFGQLLDFHEEHKACATMCVRDYDFQIPYGVVQVEEHRFTGISEKPIQRFFVNAGIYTLEPEALDYIPGDSPFDMPQLFEGLEAAGRPVTVFPIREYWMDIGQHEDLDRARSEFLREFQE